MKSNEANKSLNVFQGTVDMYDIPSEYHTYHHVSFLLIFKIVNLKIYLRALKN